MHPFSQITTKKAIDMSVELGAGPMVTAFVLGIGVVIGGDTADIVLTHAIGEFLQLVGIKVAIYASMLTAGISLMISKKWLRNLFAWLASSVAQAGFSFSAVIVGVFLGLGVPMSLSMHSVSGICIALTVAFIFAAVQWYFACLAALVNGPHLSEKKVICGQSINMKTLMIGIGLILALIAVFGLHFEPWAVTFEKQ